jgi:hypothetical protein
VHERKVTEDQALSTLTEKTMEDLCDIFLWPDGDFTFDPKVPQIKSSLALSLDPITVVCEGIRRAEMWNRMSAVIHPRSLFERTGQPLDDLGTWEDLKMARHVWVHIDDEVTVSDLLDRLPFSRYKIHRAIAELLERGFIRHCETTAAGDREHRLQRKAGEAHRAAEAERWSEAIDILQGLIAANPGRRELVDQLIEITRGFEHSIYVHNFTKDDVPVVTIGPDALSRVNIYPAEAFLLSRIDGRLKVRDILRIVPVSEFEGLRAFKRLLSAKVIDFPTRKTSTATTANEGAGPQAGPPRRSSG